MEDKDIKIIKDLINDLKQQETITGYNAEIEIQTLEKLLQAYKQDEKMIDEMSKYIWKYDCCGYEIGKSGKCKGYYIDTDCKEKCIIDYFRKKCE